MSYELSHNTSRRAPKLSSQAIAKARPLHLENCPAVCARAKWYQDPMFPDFGQYNCPYHFGVDYFAAIQDGVVHCKHLKPKEDE